MNRSLPNSIPLGLHPLPVPSNLLMTMSEGFCNWSFATETSTNTSTFPARAIGNYGRPTPTVPISNRHIRNCFF